MPDTGLYILFFSDNPEKKYSVCSLLRGSGYRVREVTSQMIVYQILTVETFHLILVDVEIPKNTGIEFCKGLRSQKKHSSIPLIVIGEDNNDGATCIAALESGSDDFIRFPFIPGVFLARIKRLLRNRASGKKGSFLSIRVSSGEFPGLLQYLEAEMKTGKLTIKNEQEYTATIFLREGRFTSARTPYCEGFDAITEILSWDSSYVTFHEMDVPEKEMILDGEITGTIMNCIVNVDEFLEIKKTMPSDDVMFEQGEKRLDSDASIEQKKILEFALKGYGIDHLLSFQKTSKVKATLSLHQLLEEKILQVSPPPFEQYTHRTFQTHKTLQIFTDRIENIQRLLSSLTTYHSVEKISSNLPFGGKDWVTPAPKIIITGDNFSHGAYVVEAFSKIATSISKTRPLVKKTIKGLVSTRLFFSPKDTLDILQLPPAFDKLVSRSINEFLADCYGVIFLVSSQDKKTNHGNLRMLRILRQRFQGIYYFIVPQILNKKGVFELRMNCPRCDFKLAVDMKMAGAMGECPICKESLTIPDCLDYLAHVLRLPNDLTIAQLHPQTPQQCGELLTMMLGSILEASRTLEHPIQLENVDYEGTVHSRKHSAKLPIIAVTDKSGESSNEHPADTHEKKHTSRKRKVVSKEKVLPHRPPSKKKDTHKKVQCESLLDEILNTNENDFDIDEFIRTIRGK